MKVKLILGILIFLVLSRISADNFYWQLSDAIDRTMSENLVLKQKQIDLDQRQAARERAWTLFLPDLKSDIGLGKDISENRNPWTISGNLGVSVNLKASLPYQFKNLQYLLEMELISYERARQIYIRDIKDLFYQILLVNERISLAKDNFKLTEMQLEKTNLLYEAGLSSDLDLMAVKVNLANTRSDILSLDNDYTSKLFQLKYLAGLSPEDKLFLTGSISLPEDAFSEEELSEMIVETMDIKVLKKENLMLRNDRKIAVLQLWNPSFNIGYSYSPVFNLPFEEGFSDSDTWQAKGALTISISLPLNSLLPGSAGKVTLESIDAMSKKNELAIDQLVYTSYMELSNLVNRLEGIHQTLDARVLAAEYSQEAYNYTVESYNAGGIDIIGLQSSESDLQKARVQVLTETYNYISTLIDLEYLLGIEIIKE